MRILSSDEVEDVRQGSLPKHVGIILDGNRRWAYARGIPPERAHGHTSAALVSTLVEAGLMQLGHLTLFCLSAENLKRSPAEVRELVRLREWLWTDEVMEALNSIGASVDVIGDLSDGAFPPGSFGLVPQPRSPSGQVTVTFAINYGSRQEIQMASSKSPTDVGSSLYAPQHPDIDLVIRPGGEQRLSNFKLWQSAYAELVFTDTLWPDFTGLHLASAIFEFQHRHRRMGG